MPSLSPDSTETAIRHELKLPMAWCFAFFVLSGFCGLVYEVIWVRLAMADFGVNTALVSIVLSVFMAGLGLGSWGARFVLRNRLSSPGSALRAYAAIELFIGLSALLVPIELRAGRQILLHQSFGAWQSSAYFVVAGFLVALALLPWCAAMGSTFPLLMAAIRKAGTTGSESSFSLLYVANVLGASVGTLASAFVLIELLGFQGTLFVAGALNLLIALLAVRLGARQHPSSLENAASVAAARPLNGNRFSRNLSLLLLFISGLVSMGMEVVWIRQFTPYLGTVVYTFAEILAVYLVGTLLGSRDYRQWARTHEPGDSRKTWTLFAASALIPVLAADPLLHFFPSSMDPLRLISIFFFCSIAGFLTPLLVDSSSQGDPAAAGTAYAVNIAGCLLGPLITSFVLLPALGERWTAACLALPLFAVAGTLATRKPPSPDKTKSRFHPAVVFVLCVILAAVLFASSHDYESSFQDRRVRRDYTATVIATGTGFQRRILVNGIGMTFLSPITKDIVHLPLALLPQRPRNGLVICFGMGTSFRSMVAWGIPTTAVDLVPSVPAMFDYFHADAASVATAPGARIVTDDGRRFLDGSSNLYDVIVVDPPPPVQAAGSSLLYSHEFNELIKQHLTAGGIFQSWYPDTGADASTAASIAKALRESFPYVRAFRSFDGRFGVHFIAAMNPIEIPSSSALAARMPPAAAADIVEWGPVRTPAQQFDLVLSREISVDQMIAASPNTPALTDDGPINEYYLLRDWFHFQR